MDASPPADLPAYGAAAQVPTGPALALRRVRVRVGARVLPASRRLRAHRAAIAARFLRGDGLEIGALHLPLPLPAGARARYVDRYDRDALRREYPELAAFPIVPVDVVDDAETLATVADATQDFLVANHLYEHTEDPIATLQAHRRVLRPCGVLYAAVPDARRTFDAVRPVTALEHHVRDHAEGPQVSRRAHYEEWARLIDRVPAGEVPARAAALDAQRYSIHFHVWTPGAFVALVEHARRAEGLPFALEAVQPAEHEFVVVLRAT
jgi:SAM-dependent methyltransferase